MPVCKSNFYIQNFPFIYRSRNRLRCHSCVLTQVACLGGQMFCQLMLHILWQEQDWRAAWLTRVTWPGHANIHQQPYLLCHCVPGPRAVSFWLGVGGTVPNIEICKKPCITLAASSEGTVQIVCFDIFQAKNSFFVLIYFLGVTTHWQGANVSLFCRQSRPC